MNDQHFNLVIDPWIKVIDLNAKTQTVSMVELFENAKQYRQLAGEMRSQDLAIMRFLLAVLQTVYSRFNAEDKSYGWLTVDPKKFQVTDVTDYDEDDLLDTWESLYQGGNFTQVVVEYLKKNQDRFDLFGEHPFYQVTKEEYDRFVLDKYKIAKGTGTVAIKQMNRRISESNNTPDLFSPKIADSKNDVDLAELVRWLICYQNFTGVTDKAKVETAEKFSTPAGWLYKLNPVYANGKNMFESLLLNLVLTGDEYYQERPVWEYDEIGEYIKWRKTELLPDNRAALYTAWSRIIHIEWSSDMLPTIYSAGIPIFSSSNAFIEPMTVWKKSRQAKDNEFIPAVKGKQALSLAMWRKFGDYVNPNKADDVHRPGIVSWLNELKNEKIIERKKRISLVSVALVSDGNATSQSPYAEVSDDLTLDLNVLFDDSENYWPKRIEDTIDLTQDVGKSYWVFVNDLARIRKLDSKELNKKLMDKFYDQLNMPFKTWLSQLTNQDDRDLKINEWKKELWKIVNSEVEDFMKNSTSRDITGIVDDQKNLLNVFVAKNKLLGSVSNKLKIRW
ncbi:type I-E CRISPR-associated protein Cse1/CasA [Lactobacillus xylocopicola]|uniref:CRISPR-associated protein n=1 Tax=Lactobacillus xylocopicola TaxID=2976676 RepID=A0ABN6SJV9_9LACO|nr:type I-E CRISPR-associated protein Cse1/CasA [Lactobacillus xylocopicola]BDR60580.1 CRISPR-associated protein [Lactobacillus xylocopicola]